MGNTDKPAIQKEEENKFHDKGNVGAYGMINVKLGVRDGSLD